MSYNVVDFPHAEPLIGGEEDFLSLRKKVVEFLSGCSRTIGECAPCGGNMNPKENEKDRKALHNARLKLEAPSKAVVGWPTIGFHRKVDYGALEETLQLRVYYATEDFFIQDACFDVSEKVKSSGMTVNDLLTLLQLMSTNSAFQISEEFTDGDGAGFGVH